MSVIKLFLFVSKNQLKMIESLYLFPLKAVHTVQNVLMKKIRIFRLSESQCARLHFRFPLLATRCRLWGSFGDRKKATFSIRFFLPIARDCVLSAYDEYVTYVTATLLIRTVGSSRHLSTHVRELF